MQYFWTCIHSRLLLWWYAVLYYETLSLYPRWHFAGRIPNVNYIMHESNDDRDHDIMITAGDFLKPHVRLRIIIKAQNDKEYNEIGNMWWAV